jgi:hypothetical protein
MSQKTIDIVLIENIITEDPEYAERMKLADRLADLILEFQSEIGTDWRKKLDALNVTPLSLDMKKAYISRTESAEDRARRSLADVTERACPICLEDYNKTDALASMPSCRHSFHYKCLRDLMAVDRRCPICRVPFARAGAAPPQ